MYRISIINVLIFVLAYILPVSLLNADSLNESNLEIMDVKFKPIRQGKNVVRVEVQNVSEQDQIFRIQIYTRSPDYGRNGVGWGTSFFDTIKGHETKWTRFAFKIQGPVTDSTYIRLDFHNPGPAVNFDEEKYFQQKEQEKWFKRVKYSSSDIEHYKAEEGLVKSVSNTESEVIIQAFGQIQNYIRDKKYEQTWQLFTKDYQDGEFQFRATAFERFKKAMEAVRPIDCAFLWEKDDFLKLQPETVVMQGEVFTLKATGTQQSWSIDFIKEDGQLKIDWIAGYTPRILLWQNWEERLLPTMEKRSTEHFDIYYFKDSTAEKEINQIAKQKEDGYSEIFSFLGKNYDIRIRIVLFEDMESKHWHTGHQGMGWAFSNTIVEVFNEERSLDPYHETTHILMGQVGSPPALFNEGFAVYMSEKLGAPALEDLGGGQAKIYERAKELKDKGRWIDLKELITYTEIGSEESRPTIAYPEAASFVKFLIDEYGKEKFLQAYGTVLSSDEKEVHRQNIKRLEQIYSKSLVELEQEWLRVLEAEQKGVAR
jgi:hypothetical protein